MTREKSISIQRLIATIVGSILSILFAGNVFFIKRLVDKIDATSEVVWELRQSVAVMKVTIDNMPRMNNCCTGKDVAYGPHFSEGVSRSGGEFPVNRL